MADPDMLEFLREVETEEDALEFCKRLGLIPAPLPPPRHDPRRPDRNLNEFWGVCRELQFNPRKLHCEGRVSTLIRHFPNGPKPQYRCGLCRKQLSQLHGMRPVNRAAHHGTWFAMMDASGKPNTKISKRAVLWIIYAMSVGLSITDTVYLMRHSIPLNRNTVLDWRNYVRELFQDSLQRAAPMGGPGDVVEIDESLFRGKRKYNRGRMLLGDQGAGGAAVGGAGGAVGGAIGGAAGGGRRNYGRRIEGPWVFGLLLRRTGELRLFRVERRDAATLLPLIRRHVAAGTAIYSDEWAAYRTIDAIPGMNYIHRTVNHQVPIQIQT